MTFVATNNEPPARGDAEWWRGAVIYQIYPRSFQDSNGDGIGDLRGIVERLPYVARLGVDAIWISPFYRSPMDDFGYDVTDYLAVDPMFGTLEDFDTLLAAAHALGLRVVIDLVVSHTSDQHAWFVESRADRDNAKRDWYVWADARADGTPPNNWLSVFGGSAWTWDGRRRQYYLHNFLASQPDLNFHEPEVRDAVLDVARHWLARGVDGFRLDTINFYFCDQRLRDNPPLAAEQRNDSIAPAVNPYNYQDHIYDKNRPENLAFLRRLRALMDEFPAVAAVGEVGDAQRGMELMGQYTAGDDHVQMCYAFELLANERLDAARFVEVLSKFDRVAADGWACWAFSNHDVARHASRWRLARDAQKLHASLLLSMRGSVCLYQGEELGLPQAELEYGDLRDPYGIEFWPEFEGRDGCRTPMVWTAEPPNAGFSGARPWLPVPAGHLPLSVSSQENDPDSMLTHYRRALEFRAAHPALARGELEKLQASGELVSFLRTHRGETIHCTFNISDVPALIELPAGTWETIESPGSSAALERGTLTVPAWQSHFARRA